MSCGSKGIEDARQVKINMSSKDLTYCMGEPWSIEVNPGYEEWFFSYNCNGYQKGMLVKIKNDKVIDFYSY